VCLGCAVQCSHQSPVVVPEGVSRRFRATFAGLMRRSSAALAYLAKGGSIISRTPATSRTTSGRPTGARATYGEGSRSLRQSSTGAARRRLATCLQESPLPSDGSFIRLSTKCGKLSCSSSPRATPAFRRKCTCRVQHPRQVARYLEDRRDFTVLQVIDALEPLAQPEPLVTRRTAAPTPVISGSTASSATTSAVLARIPLST
jgi:hypothetical protein